MNRKKVHRLWAAEGLQRRTTRRPRKRAGASSVPQVEANAPKVVWAPDFQFDSTIDSEGGHDRVDGRRAHPQSLRNIVERSITAERLTAELERVFTVAGRGPKVLRPDNGPEM